MRPIAIILLATLLLSAACSRHGQTRAALDRADSLMTEHPDSALTILQAINGPELPQGSELQAHYALLLTQARIKCHEPLAEDSLISIALDYYTRQYDLYPMMLSQYYMGRVQYYKKEYPKCMLNMFRVYENARMLDDKFWIAMGARGLGDVCKETFNGSEEVQFYKTALENFRLCGHDKNIFKNDAILDLSIGYCDNGEYKASIQCAEELMDSATNHNNDYLLSEGIRMKAMSSLGDKQYPQAVEYFETLCQRGASILQDSVYLGLSYIRNGNRDKARQILDDIRLNDTIISDWVRYEFYASLNSPEKALAALENLDRDQNKRFNERINQGLMGLLIDHYNLEKDSHTQKLQSAHRTLWFYVLLSSLVIIALISFLYYYYKKKRTEIARNVAIAENLREILALKNDESSKTQELIKSLLSTRFEELDSLCQTLYKTTDVTTAKRCVSNKVASIINEMSSDTTRISQMEEYVNKHCSNLLTDLKHDIPDLKDADYKLYLYTILGFSSTAIALFLKESEVSAVYNRKRRLKDKIKQLPSEKSQRYLLFLS